MKIKSSEFLKRA